MRANGETIYGTSAGDFPAREWGTTTRLGNRLFVHVLSDGATEIDLPLARKARKAFAYADKTPVKFTANKEGGIRMTLPSRPANTIDYIVELETD